MAELKQPEESKNKVVVDEMTAFLTSAVKSITTLETDMEGKGISVRFSADYCNSVITALKIKVPELRAKSDAVIKLSLRPFFEAQVLRMVAKNLQVIVE